MDALLAVFALTGAGSSADDRDNAEGNVIAAKRS